MTKNTLKKTALVAGVVLAPAVIGRYGAPVAELLRADVLIGFATVATLVALITLEYGRRTAVPARRLAALPTSDGAAQDNTVVSFPARKEQERLAA